MCLLIALLLAAFGYFGFMGVQMDVAPPVMLGEAAIEVAPVATRAIVCASIPEEQDIENLLALVGDTFESPNWSQSITSDANRTTGTWRSDLSGAVAYIEVLHYDCGITQQQVKQYYDDAGFQVIFANYDSYNQVDWCVADGTRLFEFIAVSGGSEYHVQYWVKQLTPTRVADFMLTFPASQPGQQAEYAGRLFPDLPTCEAAAG